MPEYAMTQMKRGGWRAECHAPDCDWWADHNEQAVAFRLLRLHMRKHRVEATMRHALSTSASS